MRLLALGVDDAVTDIGIVIGTVGVTAAVALGAADTARRHAAPGPNTGHRAAAGMTGGRRITRQPGTTGTGSWGTYLTQGQRAARRAARRDRAGARAAVGAGGRA